VERRQASASERVRAAFDRAADKDQRLSAFRFLFFSFLSSLFLAGLGLSKPGSATMILTRQR
jgi:hypothetical protein